MRPAPSSPLPRRSLPKVAALSACVLLASAVVAVQAASPAAAAEFQQVTLARGVPEVGEPMTLAVLPDRSVLHTSRSGTLRLTDAAGNTKVAGTVPVYSHDEEGLQGIGVDPAFATNRAIYLYYAPVLSTPGGDAPSDGVAADFAPYEGVNRLSRFTLNLDGTLDLASEKTVLDVPATRGICCHVGGDIDFDAAGNLYLSTGDDSNPFASDGYTPIDERASRNPAYDAQRSSGNTNDLRGKLLRIKVAADGSYSVPAGNLFAPGTAQTRPEIYAMGFRNPFRMSVDKATGIVYLGDYGPDAGGGSATRGPSGQVEFNRITGPGNFGWPYCHGANNAYVDFSFPTGPSGAAFDCAAPTNTSPNNTGLTQLPPAQAAWLPYDGGSVPEFGSGSESPMGGPVYRYDAANPSDVKFPQSYDGHFFAGEFGRQWIRNIEVTPSGGVGAINTFPWAGKQVMDMAFGPDGALYVLDYGTSYFGGDENSALYRIDYVDGNRAPTAIASGTPTSGAVPLTVAFTGSASADPDGDSLSYAWDFDSDGDTDSTQANPSHTYGSAGSYSAKLTVTDPGGKSGSANVVISAGNTTPSLTITGPASGSVVNFGATVPYQITVTDPEDGAIDCSRVTMTYIFGHDLHGHPQSTATGCSGTIATSADGEHDANANVFGVWRASYTDNSGLTGIAESITQPSTRQAEHYSDSSGVALYSKTTARGGRTVGSIDNGDWISFTPYNLGGVTGFSARVSSNGAGGTLSLRTGSPTGPVVGSATVPVTGSWETFTDVTGTVTAAGGTSSLYLTFSGGAGALYDLDEFTLNAGGTPPPTTGYKVLVFSKTDGFRHSSIGSGVAAIQALGQANGFTVDATEDAGAFTTANLAQYAAVIWLSTTNDVLNSSQQAAFESYIRAGGGYAGIHAAADTEYSWPWYGGLVGAYFSSHPQIQQATIGVEDRSHASTSHLGPTWSRYDEWYNYGTNPRSKVHVLATLDESSYSGGTMGADHPIVWCHDYDGGRSWYTGGGHTDESYGEADFRTHLLGGIRYAAGVAGTGCGSGSGGGGGGGGVESGYTSLFNGTSTAGWSQAGPGSFTVTDGALTSQGGLGMLWYSAKEFGSYSLKLDWRVEGDDNSGVFVGFPAGSDPYLAINQGYEIQIDATDAAERTTGAVYSFASADIAARDAALKPPGQWNTYEIVVAGQQLTVYLNGVLINSFTSTDPARDLSQGHIGLQNHGDGDTVSFRNIRIKEGTGTGGGGGGGGATTVTRQGESFSATSGVEPFGKPAANGGQVAGFIAAGDWIRFDGLDLTQLSGVTARVMPGQNPGGIEYRTGSPTGTLVGSAQVSATGSWNTFLDVAASTASSSATSLYLVFTGGGGGLFDVDEITLTSAAGPPPASTNLALAGTAAASSLENASHPAGNAIDGQAGTRWSSAFADPQSITVDLGSARTVDRVALVWEAAYGQAYTVATSPDGSTWTTRYSTTTGDGGTDDLPFASAVSGVRYVRVAGTTRGTPWGYSLWELQVYGR